MLRNKKYIVLFALFIVPLLFYIFLQTGTYNFGKLPVISNNIIDVSNIDNKVKFKGKVSVAVFIGRDIKGGEGEIFNLNEKIYKKLYGYADFQLIVFAEKEQEENLRPLIKKLSQYTNMQKWHFVYASKDEIRTIFDSFQSLDELDYNTHSSNAYIIDKENRLRRGKSTIKDLKSKKIFGYNMKSVAALKNDMYDDIKVVLVEYSMALKKNNNSDERRKKRISDEKH